MMIQMHIEHSFGMKSEWRDKKISFFHFLNYNLNVRDKDIKICFDNAMRSEYRK